MKKSSLYCLIGGACLITSTGLTLIANGIESTTSNDNTNHLVATNTSLITTPNSFSKNETVYVITDHAGNTTKSFVGSTINTSSEPIPVDLHITYTLDGTEITAEELSGKSGHVKITYNYTATKTYNGKKVPFLAVTGLALNPQNFTNIKTTNGKIINETKDNAIIAGYAVVGLNDNLNVDILPDYFSLEADVQNFTLDTTYTFATSEIFADLDTSRLNSIDDLISQMNQLSDGINQLIDGSSKLTSGLDSAYDGAKALQAGLATLATGANTLASGANDLASGSHQLESGAYQLKDGLNKIVDIDDQIIAKIDDATAKVIARYEEIAAYIDRIINIIRYISPNTARELLALKTELETTVSNYYNTAYSTVTTYTDGIKALYDGASQLAAGLTELTAGADSLASGASQVASGATELSLGSGTLVSGLGELSAGSHTLYNGLITFNEQGISKLASFVSNDLASLTSNLRSSIYAAKSYHSYQNPSAVSVKFIFKTPSIK